jgi:hypothetical protein
MWRTRRRRGLPGQAHGAQAGADKVAQDAREQGVGGEIAEETGRDDRVEIGDAGLERLLRRSLPVCPNKQTISAPVGTSHLGRCC